MSTPRKFCRTQVMIEILSEDPIPENATLDQIQYQVTEGEWSGEIRRTGTQELTGPEAAMALRFQGSDPSFFGLSDDGESLADY